MLLISLLKPIAYLEPKLKGSKLGVIGIRTVVVGVHPPKATYTSAKTGHWNSSGIQWKFHSSQDPLEWSGSDPHSTPLHPQSTLQETGWATASTRPNPIYISYVNLFGGFLPTLSLSHMYTIIEERNIAI
jgi:hypothetical protein